MRRYLVPLLLFGVVLFFLGFGLTLNPREVPSPLIDKPAPQFSLPLLDDADRQLAGSDLKGQVWLLNVWASWCAACLHEHPLLVELAKTGQVKLYGLNYKDKRDAALAWLQRHGNPYVQSVSDSEGRVGIDFGVYGAPETFVIDAQGMIRYKHIGALTPDVLKDKILPLVEMLRSTGSASSSARPER
ncbi:MAG: DsbE family thiol:disulfide interchange protein [Rubrivivax sp.]